MPLPRETIFRWAKHGGGGQVRHLVQGQQLCGGVLLWSCSSFIFFILAGRDDVQGVPTVWSRKNVTLAKSILTVHRLLEVVADILHVNYVYSPCSLNEFLKSPIMFDWQTFQEGLGQSFLLPSTPMQQGLVGRL